MSVRCHAEVSGAASKPVLCEHCDCAFVDALHRRSRVSGSTHLALANDEVKQAASEQAITLLDQEIPREEYREAMKPLDVLLTG